MLEDVRCDSVIAKEVFHYILCRIGNRNERYNVNSCIITNNSQNMYNNDLQYMSSYIYICLHIYSLQYHTTKTVNVIKNAAFSYSYNCRLNIYTKKVV